LVKTNANAQLELKLFIVFYTFKGYDLEKLTFLPFADKFQNRILELMKLKWDSWFLEVRHKD